MGVGELHLGSAEASITWAKGIDVPVGFICCSIGANI